MAEKVHRIRSRNGDPVEVAGYTRGKAIKAFCTECMGFSEHPRECTSPLCPLYPFRGKSLVAYGARTTEAEVVDDAVLV